MVVALCLLVGYGYVRFFVSNGRTPNAGTVSLPHLTFAVPAIAQSTGAVTQSSLPKWTLPILMYHYVRVVDAQADPLGYRLSVTPPQLAEQLDYLTTHGYHAVSPAVLMQSGPLPPKSVLLTFDDGYEDFYTAGWPIVRAHTDQALIFIITGFMGKDSYLTSAQVRELAAQGVTVGAHTITHVNLATQSPTELTRQLMQPKQVLEQLLQTSVPYVAYPSGKYNAGVLSASAIAGYKVGVTTHFGLATNNDDHLEFPRIEILGSDSLADFAKKVEGIDPASERAAAKSATATDAATKP